MNILLIIREVYSNNDDENVIMVDGTKIFYKNFLVLELGKTLAKLNHNLEITSLKKILGTNNPLYFLNKFDLIIKFSLRDTIFDSNKRCYLSQSKAKIIFFDAPLFFRNTSNSLKHHKFIRIMIDNNFGNNNFIEKYHQKNSRIAKMNLQVQDWKKSNGYILMINQLVGDTAIDPINPYEWLEDTIIKIKKITSRQILVRDHPLQLNKHKEKMLHIVNKYRLLLSNKEKIKEDLDTSQVCVTFSSGSAIDALIEGIPVIATDKRNYAYEICDHKVENILNPSKKNRIMLFESLSNVHWELKEIQNMTMWNYYFQNFFKNESFYEKK